MNYIHMNPVKHGYCADPGDWPHSSLRRFMAVGLRGPDAAPAETVVGPTAE